MKFKVAAHVLDHKGRTIPDTNEKGESTPLTFGTMLERLCVVAGNPQDSADDKFAQYKLAHKLGRAVEIVDLSPEEIVRLKKLAAQGLNAVAYGAIVEMLDDPMFPPLPPLPPLPAPAVEVHE